MIYHVIKVILRSITMSHLKNSTIISKTRLLPPSADSTIPAMLKLKIPNSSNGRTSKLIDLLDSGGYLTLVTEGIKNLIDVTEVRNETFNVVTSAGIGLQRRDKVGY